MQKESSKTIDKMMPRPPVVAVLGHVDHGKSTLLDYIRKTNITAGEAGGITQKIAAYEVVHDTKEGGKKTITFLDTPGHEAFKTIRTRGARVADIALLIVAADDGVKPQTIEAYETIKKAGIPFIVTMTKADKDGADIERVKAMLAEAEIFVEGYGGDVPWVAVSGTTGAGIPELLDLINLVAELQNFTGTPSLPASGAIIEASVDRKKGITATLIIRDGTLESGMSVAAGTALAPVRILENFLGTPIKSATFSSPIRIIGWNQIPNVGDTFTSFTSKKEAEEFIEQNKIKAATAKTVTTTSAKAEEAPEQAVLALVIKAADVGGLDAVKHEIAKIKHEKLILKIVQEGVGDIAEIDVKNAGANRGSVILGFGVKTDATAKSTAEKNAVEIQNFDIIYKLSEWVAAAVAERAPKTKTEEQTGLAKVLKIFSKMKDKQVIGCRMEKGLILQGAEVKILRRDFPIGEGKIRELQKQKNRVSEVPEGQEFGALIESKTDIAPGDRLEAFKIVEK